MMEKQMRNLACGVAAMALIFNVSAAAAQHLCGVADVTPVLLAVVHTRKTIA